MSHNKTTTRRRSVARTLRNGLLDGSACWAIVLVGLGFGLLGADNWWGLAFAFPAVLLAIASGALLAHHRHKHEQLKGVAAALVRHYWADVPDHRADALDYVPHDILAQALEAGDE